MPDIFSSEISVGRSAIDIVRVLLLQSRANVFDAIEDYIKKSEVGSDPPLNIIKARLYVWWLEMEPYIKRRHNEEEYKKVHDNLESNDYDELKNVIHFLNRELDKLEVTKLDIKRRLKTTDFEEANLFEATL